MINFTADQIEAMSVDELKKLAEVPPYEPSHCHRCNNYNCWCWSWYDNVYDGRRHEEPFWQGNTYSNQAWDNHHNSNLINCTSCEFSHTCITCDRCHICDRCSNSTQCDNCEDCNNCLRCKTCKMCDSCTDSKKLLSCGLCILCVKCETCFNCSKCKNCINCNFCYNSQNQVDKTYVFCNVQLSQSQYSDVMSRINS